MSYKILPTREFSKDFKKIDSSVRITIKKKIDELSEDPTRHKHLHPPLAKFSRLRVGKFRVIFDYDLEKKEVYLRKIVFKHKY